MAEPGAACSPDGAWAFDAGGAVLVCQGGQWLYVPEPRPIRPFDPDVEEFGAAHEYVELPEYLGGGSSVSSEAQS
jgi:hypothetical protein